MSSFYNSTKVPRIIGIVERLRLRSSNRLTVNVIRNQQRNRRTSNETNIASPQSMEYDSSPLVGLRRSFASIIELLSFCQQITRKQILCVGRMKQGVLSRQMK